MGSHPLETAIADYRRWVSQLTTEGDAWSEETVLATLSSRDRIQHLIDQRADAPDDRALPAQVWPQIWIDLSNTDAELGRQGDRLRTLPALAHWRKSVSPPEHHWWWYPPEPEPPKDALAWLWGGLTIAMLTISLALTQDIASRFTVTTPGLWNSLGAIVPVVLTLFASGGALTQVGQQALENILSSRGHHRKNWPRLKFALALALALGLFAFHSLGLPRIARAYNQQGEANYTAGDWASAQNNFQLALSLKPDYPQAQFNMGVLYEEFQQWDQARAEYLKAVRAGYLPAYNNLARLNLQQGDPEAAVTLLRTALSDPSVQGKGPELQYVLYKNLGQARLDQGRPAEAETALMEAIDLNQALDPPRPDAHCLLAQAIAQRQEPPAPYDGGTSPPTAQEAWARCLQLANRPEHDRWESMARQALTQPGNVSGAN